MPKSERYPYEEAIEELVQRYFKITRTFDEARRYPMDLDGQKLMAIRQLIYDAMTESFNRGIEISREGGKRGMHVN